MKHCIQIRKHEVGSNHVGWFIMVGQLRSLVKLR
ncbi:hypothetical protein T4C_95 [Trichinella pseudospiralis]|uniref:Uncharacterized protein n=1 Tax=Trichinella pseudospiralis TaxID=6337 RepID=A0A0V1GA92_TRIPS|nr:hypothetical protein T4C_95 [Trichinella pseudospiralis]